MRFSAAPLEGRLVRRYQRFFAEVETDAVELAGGARLIAHCPNTGSLLGCLAPGSRVWLRDSENPARKLRFTWQAVRVGRTWVNVDTALPNRVVAEAASAGRVPELAGYARLRREVPYGRGSRIDLLLEDDARGTCHVEVKSTTLAEDGAALFPDAVTERGTKHLLELTRLARRGMRAVQFFFVSRGDVELFRPADAIDPEYGRALRRAVAAGVEVLAYAARVEARRLALLHPLTLDLAAPRKPRHGQPHSPGPASLSARRRAPDRRPRILRSRNAAPGEWEG
jgi:sugar fermentation stimulation protein A